MIPHVKVLRDQQQVTIHVDEIVMDDIMILEAGDQICCDSVVIDGEIVPANIIMPISKPHRKIIMENTYKKY